MQRRGSRTQRPSSRVELVATSSLSAPRIQLRGATGLCRA